MKRNGKGYGGMIVGAALVLFILVAFVTLNDSPTVRKWVGGTTLSQEDGLTQKSPSTSMSCPTSLLTSTQIDVQNYLNTTGAEGFDVTAYLVSSSGQRTTITDTTAPTATNLNCGETYSFEIVRGNSQDGDNSKAMTIIGGSNAVIQNGVVKFTPSGGAYNLRVGASQHATAIFQATDKDGTDAAMCYGGANCANFQADGVTFQSTSNGTAKVVGTDGWLDVALEVRANLSDADFTDYYTLMLVEAPLATWQEPSVKIGGVKYSNVKGKGVLTPEEETAFSGYEYIYKYEKSIMDGQDGALVEFYMQAKTGVNPSVDPEIDFAAAGRYLSVDGVTTKVGAADDTSSNAAVFDVQDVTFDIS
jgi:hypothetical protein